MRTLVPAVVCIFLLCLSASGAEDVVVAKVGDRKFTKAEIERIAAYNPEAKRHFQQSPQNRAVFLKRIVQSYALAEKARKEGFDRRPDIREQLDLSIDNFLASQYVKIEIADKISATEEEMVLYYKSRQDEFKVPEKVKARHILVMAAAKASEEEKKRAREKAEEILKRIKAGEDFAKLASEFSDDPGSKAKGGDLGFFARGKMVKPFEEAAFSLAAGQVSDIVETPFGYHIIKVEEKTEAYTEPYDKVKDKVKDKATAELRKARVSDFVDTVINDAGVELYLDKLE